MTFRKGIDKMIDIGEQLKNDISNADMILVGIGEEFEEQFERLEIVEKHKKNNKIEAFIRSKYIRECNNKEIMYAYQTLEGLIRNKNYFIVSTSKDNYISHTNLKKDRMVFPCGGYQKLQCENKCGEELYDADKFVDEIIAKLYATNEFIESPHCEKCGAPLVFNNIFAENYNENGYLEQWSVYSKWLQGTLNRKLCILELGVGMSYPTVIRWPFEKIAFFNQKSSFYRVHSKLYQLSEVIKDKGNSIAEDPISLLTKKLSY